MICETENVMLEDACIALPQPLAPAPSMSLFASVAVKSTPIPLLTTVRSLRMVVSSTHPVPATCPRGLCCSPLSHPRTLHIHRPPSPRSTLLFPRLGHCTHRVASLRDQHCPLRPTAPCHLRCNRCADCRLGCRLADGRLARSTERPGAPPRTPLAACPHQFQEASRTVDVVLHNIPNPRCQARRPALRERLSTQSRPARPAATLPTASSRAPSRPR